MSERQLSNNRVRCPSDLGLSLEELVLSKTRLAVECSKEILRLTHMVKVLREETQAMQAALISGNPLPISEPMSSKPSTPAPPPAEKTPQEVWNPRQNTDIVVRRMQGSMRFERPDLSEVLLGQILGDCEEKSIQVEAGAQTLSQEIENPDVYEVETEIKDKRGSGSQTEYQVRKRIIYSRWQTLKDLEQDNLHDFAKIYDFKVRDGELNKRDETQETERVILNEDVDIATSEDWDVSSSAERLPPETVEANNYKKPGDLGIPAIVKPSF